MLLSQDTVQVFTHSGETRSIIAALTPWVAPALVFLAGWWSTTTQRRNATEAIAAQRELARQSGETQRELAQQSAETQRQLAQETLENQRRLAEQSLFGQLETARIDRIVNSRKEWMRDVRHAVAAFQEKIQYLQSIPEDDPQTPTHRADSMREVTHIAFLLNRDNPNQARVFDEIERVIGWLFVNTAPEATDKEMLARYKKKTEGSASMSRALRQLDDAVNVVLKEEWQKIKKGK
jgi:hypothetical protein